MSLTHCYAIIGHCIIELLSPQNALLEQIDALHEALNQMGLLSARLGKKLQVWVRNEQAGVSTSCCVMMVTLLVLVPLLSDVLRV